MARDLRPKHKLCRKFGEKLCDSPKCPVVRRNYPPGVHGPKGKGRVSEYGRQLNEKQKAKAIYGILEQQFYKTYKKAVSQTGNSAENLFRALETRLDNVVYRLHFAQSRRQARQMISHKHILVNGKQITIPSYVVKENDAISVAEKAKKTVEQRKSAVQGDVLDWLQANQDTMDGHVVAMPQLTPEQQGLNFQLIIEFYSR
jgi:small subunit ribosomal protein S4